MDHLVFALRYDGVELHLLAQLFTSWDPQPLVEALRQTPLGQELRRLWFLHEWLTGASLPLDDLRQGNYIDLLDADRYYTQYQRRSSRHRLRINLLGSRDWCPMLRRTSALRTLEAEDLRARIHAQVAGWDPQLLLRAVAYLYTKETKSSFSIEREEISGRREHRFVAMLRRASTMTDLDKSTLLELLRETVEPSFFTNDYRDHDLYVGETTPRREIVHYVPPRWRDVPNMMTGLLGLTRQLLSPSSEAPRLHPVIVAAIVGFSFVYIHPFPDGNGRLHRFLVHYILSRTGFSPSGLVLPVSAAILNDPIGYDRALEQFSRELMQLVDYKLDDRGEIHILHDTRDDYRFVDLTHQTEALFGWVKRTIEHELVEEIEFLRGSDRAKLLMRDILELPDREEQLFITLCARPPHKLSKSKRDGKFARLSDAEITALETAVQHAFTEHTDL